METSVGVSQFGASYFKHGTSQTANVCRFIMNIKKSDNSQEPPEATSWWARPCGGKEVLAIAMPLVISTMSFTIMLFCDRMFLSWHSTEAMAASLSAGMLNWTMFSLPLGVAMYAQTFVAQYHGAGQPERIGAAVFQGLRIGLYSCPLFALSACLAPLLFMAFGHPERLLVEESNFLRVLSFGAPASVMGAALGAFFIGRGQTSVVMKVNIGVSVLNIVLDILLIFGLLGFPAMGIVGAGLATIAAQWTKLLVYWWLIHRGDNPKTYAFAEGAKFDGELIRRMLKFGGPNGMQMMLEGSAGTLFALYVAKLGALESAATSLAFNVNMIAFLPIVGLGVAVSTLVGQQMGRKRPDMAARATYTSLILAGVYTSLFGALFLAIPDLFMGGHAAGMNDFESVRPVTLVLLRFVAAYCLFDAVQLVFVSAIKGAGDTRFVLVVTVLMSAAFVVGGVVADQWGQFGLYGWWWMFTAWIWILAIIYALRFHQGRWRGMSVISPQR